MGSSVGELACELGSLLNRLPQTPGATDSVTLFLIKTENEVETFNEKQGKVR